MIWKYDEPDISEPSYIDWISNIEIKRALPIINGPLRVSGSIESMLPKTDFTVKIVYFDYWGSRGVNRFPLGPTVWKLPSGHKNTINYTNSP